MATKTNISTTIEAELKQIAQREGINFNTALEFGVKFLLAEKDLAYDYPTSKLQAKLLAVNNRLAEQLENTNKEDDNEADEILSAEPTKEEPEFKPASELE